MGQGFCQSHVNLPIGKLGCQGNTWKSIITLDDGR